VPVTVLWANLHGTFFLAPILLGLAWIEDRSSGGHVAPTALVARCRPDVSSCSLPWGSPRELRRILAPGQVGFNAHVWGSWLEFEFPRNPAIVDSRMEVVPTPVWWKYYAVSRGSEGWQEILHSWHVDVPVLARDQQLHLIPRIKGGSRLASGL